ncbi:sensor histidine kinase [Chitinophaga sp. Hz27]|uniref:sensor histidine kinase n=1 Tax=Chitinophaga sp. Hz27 TaxID=3347169 RepID=UPI0035D5AD62
MNKLLNRSLRVFIIYSAVVLLASVPVYYLIVDFIWKHEIKEHNRIEAAAVRQNLDALNRSGANLETAVALWNQLHATSQLTQVAEIRPDSTYNIYRKNQYLPQKGYDRFEGLATWFTIDGNNYRLAVETNMEESYETIPALGFVTGMFFIILIAGLIYLNKRISVRLWQPFYDTIKRLQTFDLQQYQQLHFPDADIEEFNILNQSLDKLIRANQVVYQQQKEFTQNASHELQTPLAIIRFKLDLLYQSPHLTAEQSALIDQAYEALSRVSRLNKNLLLLAKIENSQFPDKEDMQLKPLLEEKLLELQDFFHDKSQRVQTAINEGIGLHVNITLMDILLNNLLLNAIRYSDAGSEIRITATIKSLTVANPGKTALLTENLFQRFGTVTPDYQGTGLGLAIIQQISIANCWEARYNYSDGYHHFIICLKS